MTLRETSQPPCGLPLGGLNSQQSSQRLEQIAKLRARGIGDHVGLPQLVVCGDQSAGKSSVLEGLTGIPFPRQDGICTKFPTEIILQHSAGDMMIVASIIPCLHRTEEERIVLRTFRRQLGAFEDLPQIINEVTRLLGVRINDADSTGSAFVEDVLRIEVTGPVGLHISVVDLPGLISVPNEEQSDGDVQTVHRLVDSYLSNERTIILAVVQAGNDIANQSIIKKSRKYDHSGTRTVGIITKPDLVNEGTEKRIALLARNRDSTKLKLGFFLVKNPTPNELAKGVTPEQRRKTESQYFHDSPYAELGLDPDRTGILALQKFLQRLLDQHVEKELPKVREDVRKLLLQAEADLSTMGEQRDSPAVMRIFLTRLSTLFQNLVQSALDGTYETEHEFFATGKNSHRRMRAVVQNLNLEFAETMRIAGKKRTVIENRPEITNDGLSSNDTYGADEDDAGQMQVTRNQMIAWIKEVYQNCRGKELPGNYNHVLLSELFREQSSRWYGLAEAHVKLVCNSISEILSQALREVVSDDDVISELREVISVGLDQASMKAEAELQRLWQDEQVQPITYNHYYTDNIQRDRQQRMKSVVRQAITQTRDQDWNGRMHISNTVDDIDRLMTGIERRIIVDMDQQACEEALSGLQAYYKVSMKTFVDNVCRQVIERHLTRHLPGIFSPESVAAYEDEKLARIAAETPETVAKRRYLEDHRENLRNGLDDLGRPCRSSRSG